MDGAGDNFFAGAAFAADENGGIALRDAGDELFHLANLTAFANEVVVELSSCFSRRFSERSASRASMFSSVTAAIRETESRK